MKNTRYLILIALPLLNISVWAEDIDQAVPSARMSVSSIVNGNTSFAFDLYARLKAREGNLFVSPYSISTALAMTYAGARNDTATQMAQTLHFASNQREFHPTYRRLIDQLNEQGQKGDYQLTVANALWAQKDYTFLESFINLNQRNYKAELENVDFVKETEPTRVKINQWVEDKTQSKIKDLIPPGILDSMTRLVLTNAIYFKGDWAGRFDGQQTRAEPFYVSQEKTVQAPLMYRKGQYPYGEHVSLRNDRRVKVQVLVLPYKGNDVSMVVLLPEKGYLRHVEEDLSTETLAVWTSQLRSQDVEVFLPKFRMSCQFSLDRTLAAMGMPDAFGDAADFSGMTGAKDLLISDVLHKAFVEVNEEGTEAAAATGVVMRLRSMPAPTPVFRADRPFVFVIRDNATGSILFMGRVADPTDSGS
ncbi:MAG: serpin family protein [Phycisphaerae bacterium]|nr:serpin family protein [Phycisphaerae bacterium]